MRRQERGRAIRHSGRLLVSDELDELAGVDLDRAGCRAEPVGGAGLQALIVEQGLELIPAGGGLSPGPPGSQLAISHNAMPGRQRKGPRRAVRLAEPAFDALVDDRVGRGEGLEILEVYFGVGVEDHARVEQVFRVEELLDLLHQAERLFAPFLHDERGHVSARAVLSLEGPVVLRDDHCRHFFDEGCVAGDLGGIIEILREDEVEVPFERMAEDDRVHIAVLRQQALEVERRFGKPVHRKRDVLDDDGRSRAAHRTDRGEQALSDVPEFLALGRIGREFDRAGSRQVGHSVQDQPFLLCQLVRVGRPRLDEQRRDAFVERREVIGHAVLSLDGPQGGPVHQLHGVHGAALQGGNRLARRLDIREQHQAGRLVGQLIDGVVGDLRDEAKRSFRPDHQVLEDVHRIVEVDQGVETVAGRVLHLVLRPDAVGQGGVGLDPTRQAAQSLDERCVGFLERRRLSGSAVSSIAPSARITFIEASVL